MSITDDERHPFPTQYHIATTCYLARDGSWQPTIDEAGAFESEELPYLFLGGCTLIRAEPDPMRMAPNNR